MSLALKILLIVDGVLLLGLLAYVIARFVVTERAKAKEPSSVEPIDYKHGVDAETFAKELALARAKLAENEVVLVPVEQPEEQEVQEEIVEIPAEPEELVVSEPVEEPIEEVEEVVVENKDEEIEEQPETAVTVVEEDGEDDREIVRRVPFCEKMVYADRKTQEYYNVIYNELISYKKVHARVSAKGVSYRLGRDLIAKITYRGKTMKLHLELPLEDFPQNVFFQKDMSDVKAYEEVPFTVKVKSDRAVKNAVKLIVALAERKQLVKNPKFVEIDAVEDLKKLAIELR